LHRGSKDSATSNIFNKQKKQKMQKTKTVLFYTVQENVISLKKGEEIHIKSNDYQTGRRDRWWFIAPEDCFLVVPTTWFHDGNGREWIQPTVKATIGIWQESFNSNAKMELIADIDNKRVVSPRIYSPHWLSREYAPDPSGELWVLPKRSEYLSFLRERRELTNKMYSIVDDLKKMGTSVSVIETELH